MTFEPDRGRRGNRGADLRRRAALHAPVLQRSQTITVHDRIDIRRSAVEALAHHPAGLAMGIAALPLPTDAGRQRHVPRQLAPGELERILAAPQVRPAAGDDILVGLGPELDRPGVTDSAEIGRPLENPEPTGVAALCVTDHDETHQQSRCRHLHHTTLDSLRTIG
jgi:hypothetical protein